MAPMKEKIKNFFGFIGRAWDASWRGKIGVLMVAFALFMFVRIFWGTVNVQRFIVNIWRLDVEQTELATQREKLDAINRHIELLQSASPDYVQELGLKYLNIGDPKFKILKI